jgi:hypothetical protein
MDYKPELLSFSKPKKHGDYFISKVKYPESETMVVQFPRMIISSDPTNKSIELEFKNQTGYNKKIYDFLSKIDEQIISSISLNSEDWFGKKIPTDAVSKMYHPFIKSPKTTENNSTLNFNFNIKKDEFLTELINSKNEQIEFTDLKKGSTVEVIAQMKYVVFSKDSSFITWEISCAKLHKRVNRVPKFGFIEDPEDCSQIVESEDEEIEIHTFF